MYKIKKKHHEAQRVDFHMNPLQASNERELQTLLRNIMKKHY